MNSPYSRMCNQLEHFVDAESEVADTKLFNRPPLNEQRNGSVDLSPELDKAATLVLSTSTQSPQYTHSASTPTPNSESRSLWLGNVDPTVTEEEIHIAFTPFGTIENVRLLPAKECAFVNYYELDSAIRGRNAMQGKPLGNMILRIGFGKISDPILARDSINLKQANHNQSRSVWIGNLGSEITCDILMLHFNAFGPIESCRVLEAKNCAFVNYYTVEAASLAKAKMNGILIGNSVVKTGNAKETSNSAGDSNVNGITNKSYINEPYLDIMKSASQDMTTFQSILKNPLNDLKQQQEQVNKNDEFIDGNQLREFRRIVESSPEEIPMVLSKLLQKNNPTNLKELSVDSYGNILLQKMIERAQITEQEVILKELKGSLTGISMHKNGTWVIQKLITSCSPSVQKETIEELRDGTVELFEDQFGNYVIQCILITLPNYDENSQIICDKIIQNSRKLATGKFSSRALKSVLDSSTLDRQKFFAKALARESVLLSVDPNGAVVIQWILDSELPGKIGLITGQLQGRLAQVAPTKQGSVIVARSIGSSDEPKYRDEAILELYELGANDTENQSIGFSSRLDSLLAEPATCSILFKSFQVSKLTVRLRLAKKLEPKLMKILKDITGDSDENKIKTYTEKECDEKIPVHLIKLYQELIKIRMIS